MFIDLKIKPNMSIPWDYFVVWQKNHGMRIDHFSLSSSLIILNN